MSDKMKNHFIVNLPHDLYTAKQTRELDRIASDDHHLSSSILMQRAGAAALDIIEHTWPEAKQLLILCGTGNNGGDGFELARQAAANNYHVTVFQIGQDKALTQNTAAAKQALITAGTIVQSFAGVLPNNDVIVDALFGTGLNRRIEGETKVIIDAINALTCPTILALDIPSGLHADTGNVLGCAIKATITVSYIGLNIGLLTGHGSHYCGNIYFNALDTPPAIYQHFLPLARRISLENDTARLGPRDRSGHKGLYGHLLIIGGDHGMSGAARLAAEAGARVGAGLTTIATRAAHAPLLNLTRPELMCHGVDNVDELTALLGVANALTIGPGLGQSSWSAALFQKAINADLPMVIDADALNLLSDSKQRYDHWILTPHPGEAARMLNCTSMEVQADRVKAVQALQDIYGGIVILKGPGTIINNGKLPLRLASCGNPGMSSGGMGDVLAG
ncbi:UNVERIFIED_CONTAM: hypothetical protein GTU68_019188, partial [Idotea baltica]|nr:hypothetical protein [Idotea baltica]